MNDLNKKCMGEFPMFPGWLFFEEFTDDNAIAIYAYGSNNRVLMASSQSRENSIANVLNQILEQYPPKNR